MTNTQKVIKYLAIAFAFSIIINIVYFAVFAIFQFTNMFGLVNDTNDKKVESYVINTNNNISSLEISIQYSSLEIINSDKFLIETNNKYIKVKENNNKLTIKENNKKLFTSKNTNKITLYIPYNFIFDDVDINSGVGNINIDLINSKDLNLKIGAGKITIKDLFIANKAKIEGGAGKITISSGQINNLNLDSGVGKVSIRCKLTGNNNISSGIGETNLLLLGDKENYTVIASKGIGTISFNDIQISDGALYGNGENLIKIDGGIGSINISTRH
ncbi:MAG: DUF4097 domain-containing protein [Tenericutes bacterium]|nr:DUF4097 domain-containing protein [Mycoplasmatota bacterium]